MSDIIMKIGQIMLYGGCIMAVCGVMILLIGMMMEETL